MVFMVVSSEVVDLSTARDTARRSLFPPPHFARSRGNTPGCTGSLKVWSPSCSPPRTRVSAPAGSYRWTCRAS